MKEKEIEYELIEVIQLRNRKYAIIAEKGNTEEALVRRVVQSKGQKDFAEVSDDEFKAVMEKYEEKFKDMKKESHSIGDEK